MRKEPETVRPLVLASGVHRRCRGHRPTASARHRTMSPTRPVRADRPAVSLRAETSPVVSQAQSPSSSSPSRKAGDRSSFVSVKEDDTGVAQTFLDSNTTTLTQTDVGGTVDHDDQAADTTMAATLVMPQPPSFCCPCARFRGWKQVQLRGRWSSRSVGDLRLLGGNDKNIWAWDDQPPASSPSTSRKTAPQTHGPGLSRLEALPTEILGEHSWTRTEWTDPTESAADGSV